jgi:hypothetical protein
MEVNGQFHLLADLEPWGRSAWYALERGLRWSQSLARCFGKEKNFYPCRKSKPNSSDVQAVARRHSNCAIPDSSH